MLASSKKLTQLRFFNTPIKRIEYLGGFLIYKDDTDGPVVLNFAGITRPTKEEEVISTLQKVLD